MILQQNTAWNHLVFLVAASDHISGLAGATLTITASKNGGAFASISPTVTDLGNGWYNVALTAAMLNTLGEFALHITAATADPIDEKALVVAYNPLDATALGLSRVDAAISSRAAPGAQMTLTSGEETAIQAKILSDATPFQGGRIDAAISSRAAPSDILVTPANKLATDASNRVTVGALANAVITGAAIAAGAIDSSKAPNLDVAVSTRTAWGDVLESTLTAQQMIRILLAVMAGKVNGASGGAGTINFRDYLDAKNRVVAVVDVNGNRTTVTLDGT